MNFRRFQEAKERRESTWEIYAEQREVIYNLDRVDEAPEQGRIPSGSNIYHDHGKDSEEENPVKCFHACI